MAGPRPFLLALLVVLASAACGNTCTAARRPPDASVEPRQAGFAKATGPPLNLLRIWRGPVLPPVPKLRLPSPLPAGMPKRELFEMARERTVSMLEPAPPRGLPSEAPLPKTLVSLSPKQLPKRRWPRRLVRLPTLHLPSTAVSPLPYHS